MSTDSDRVIAFLDDLNALTLRHGIALWSCGCCSSIELHDLTRDNVPVLYQEVDWNDDARQYEGSPPSSMKAVEGWKPGDPEPPRIVVLDGVDGVEYDPDHADVGGAPGTTMITSGTSTGAVNWSYSGQCLSTHGGAGYTAGSYWDGDEIVCPCGARFPEGVPAPSWIAGERGKPWTGPTPTEAILGIKRRPAE